MQGGNCYSHFIDEGLSPKEVRSFSQERVHSEKMMRPVLRTSRLHTTHSISASTLGSRDYYLSHFTDKETGPERSSKLPEATPLETRFRPRQSGPVSMLSIIASYYFLEGVLEKVLVPLCEG